MGKQCRFWRKATACRFEFLKKASQHCCTLLCIAAPMPAGPESHVLTAVPALEDCDDLNVNGTESAADWRLPLGLPRVIRVQ